MKKADIDKRVKDLMAAGYSRKLALAIAKYPRERWTQVRRFQEKRRREAA